MNKHTKGIERALRMKQWSDKKGGLPAREDPFEGGEAGVFDRRVRQWIAELQQRELSPATIETYRWPLLRFRTWLLKHLQASTVGFTVFLNPPLTTVSQLVLSLLFPAIFVWQLNLLEILGGGLALAGLALALWPKR